MCAIDFSGFTWDTAATVFTGISAVIAAYKVGTKQANISKGMAEIQEVLGREQAIISKQLASTEAAKLRAELFERRMKIYEVAFRALHRLPADFELEKGDRELAFSVQRGFLESKFIFNNSAIHDLMDELSANIGSATMAHKNEAYFIVERNPGRRHKQRQIIEKIGEWSAVKLNELDEIFKAEIAITLPE